jgi:Fe2+ or Zn2+ uptake regulation protein
MQQRFVETLKKKKMRITEARRSVYNVLEANQKRLSVQDVFSQINEKTDFKTDKVSVYRNLSLFSELGLVHRFQDGKYSLCIHQQDEGHQHLHVMASCNQCGATFEMQTHDKNVCRSVNQLKTLIQDFGDFSGVNFLGTCTDCSDS